MEVTSSQRLRDPQAPLIFGIALGVSALLGLIAGSAFFWADTERGWNLFLAGFLWTLISAAGTGLLRCVRERVHRDEWRRGMWIGAVMTFPLTTAYLLVFALLTAGVTGDPVTLPNGGVVAAKPELLVVAPICYAMTLIVALLVGPVYVLTSPFGRRKS
jgi:hypothetical protein